MNQEKDFFYIAELSTGQIDYVDDYYEKVKTNKIFNLQLRYWTESLYKFQKLDESHFILEEALLIINCLCNSLETLAGVNINPVDYTPPLVKMYEETLKKDKGWDFTSDKPKLLEKLKEMDNYHKNICKHINKSNFKREMLKEINYEKLEDYMSVTQEIWLWVLTKAFNGNIPKDQLLFFKDNCFQDYDDIIPDSK